MRGTSWLLPQLRDVKDCLVRASRQVRRVAADRGVPLSNNDRSLHSLRNRHAGRSAVIIGMGPSLRVEDLDRFSGFVSFACNKIYLAFGQTDWRPDYYGVNDVLVAENNAEEIRQVGGPTALFPSYLRHQFAGMPNAIFLPRYTTLERASHAPHYREHPVEGLVSGGGTVLLMLIQVAFWTGCSEVYVVGLDFSFQVPASEAGKTHRGETVVVSAGEVNHFHPGYRKKGERWTIPRMEEQTTGFAFARQAFQAADRKLLNASRTSRLDVLERVAFDSVFSGEYE